MFWGCNLSVLNDPGRFLLVFDELGRRPALRFMGARTFLSALSGGRGCTNIFVGIGSSWARERTEMSALRHGKCLRQKYGSQAQQKTGFTCPPKVVIVT